MHFVTSKRAGYVLFCMTPSGRAAIGLTDERAVHLLERGADGGWRTMKAWEPGTSTTSHTDVMLALGDHEEPADPRGLLALAPRD